eukprot:gene176-3970_t
MAVIGLILCTMLVAVSQAEPFIGNDLPDRIPGPAITGALGPDRMEIVASSYGMNVAKLQATIDQDIDDIWLTKTGKLVYACKGSEDHAHHHHHHRRHLREEERSLAGRQLIKPHFVPADAYHLHSRPGAPFVVHLDFNGEVVVAKEWVNESQIGNRRNRSWPEAGRAAGRVWSGVWQGRVVTRRPICRSGAVNSDVPDPGLDAIERSGQRVIISADVEAEASCECVGEAFLGTFGNNSDTPSFVYSTRLNTYNIASQAAHLVGHSLGLSHDGNSSFPTFEGHGADYNSWGPIMGAPFGKYVRQWSKGDYRDANNTEDDVATISSKIPLRPNDHGSDTGSATLLTTTECGNANVTTEGIISTAGQSDYFRIETLSGYIVAQVQLRDVDGNVLITSPPPSPTQAPSFESYQPAGTYYVSVTGIGFGDGFDTGYTNYGSLGPYMLNVQYVSIFTPFSHWADEEVASPTSCRPLTVAKLAASFRNRSQSSGPCPASPGWPLGWV